MKMPTAAQLDAAMFLATVVLAPATTAKVLGLLIQPLFLEFTNNHIRVNYGCDSVEQSRYFSNTSRDLF